MKKVIALGLILFVVIGCGSKKSVLLTGPAGEVGSPGAPGAPGHSQVSISRSAGEQECAISGSALDVYLDLDDSLTVSEGDLLQSGLLACNGAPGVNGINGVDGAAGSNGADGADGQDGVDGADGADGVDGSNATATMTAYTITSSCQVIASGWSAKKHDSDSVRIYESSNCSGSAETMDEDNDDVFVLSSTTLLIFQDMVLRKLVFN